MPNALTQFLDQKVTPIKFYSSRIAVKENQFNPLHHAGKLFQQYLVHAYCTVERERLSYLRANQKDLRVEAYQGLLDFLAEQAQQENLRAGNLFILPKEFLGGPRYMREKYHDAMTIVRKFGRPDIFVTFTTNPKWPEIKEQLAPYQEASDRPDIVARVFRLKMKQLVDLICKGGIFGKVHAYVVVVEFQKRGLPHIHTLYWLDETDRLLTGDQVDRIISAELPSRTDEPELYEVVTRNMIHGPCDSDSNALCKQNGVCKKQFPKPFQESTDTSGNGYPKYRRRDNSNEGHNVRGSMVHNGWVVPYNPFLSKMFNAHINVEMCHTIQVVKYLCKYFTKGHDRARATVRRNDGVVTIDEIQDFVDTRCITPPEAAWRILENIIYDQSHMVYKLSVHLPDGQAVFFEEGQEEAAVARAATRNTTLTAWFKLNETDERARNILYPDIPGSYVWEMQGDQTLEMAPTWRKHHYRTRCYRFASTSRVVSFTIVAFKRAGCDVVRKSANGRWRGEGEFSGGCISYGFGDRRYRMGHVHV